MFEILIFVNKRFTSTLNDAVNRSNWHLFFEAKELSHIKSVNEMTGTYVYIVHFFWKFEPSLGEDLIT